MLARHHAHRPHSMPVGSSSTGVASAYWVTVQRPAAWVQVAANVQGGLLVFWIVVWPPLEVMIAVSPGWVRSRHCRFAEQTVEAPSCSTTVVLPRCDRMSSTVPRTPMVASGVVIL